MNERSIVLLSGGLDSTTCLAWALAQGHECITLAIDYGQRHRGEIDTARRVAAALGARAHHEVRIDLRAIGGSALTDEIDVPKDRADESIASGIPVTYVPARNTVFLSVALGLAETKEAGAIVAGMNAVDYSGYPDCRPDFIRAFEEVARLGTRAGDEGKPVKILTPLMALDKAGIIELGISLGVDYGLTHSCYDPATGGEACGRCDACRLRLRGFRKAGLTDPIRYAATPKS